MIDMLWEYGNAEVYGPMYVKRVVPSSVGSKVGVGSRIWVVGFRPKKGVIAYPKP